MYNNHPAAACLDGQCLSTPYCDEENANVTEFTGTARRPPCSACVEEDPCRPYCHGKCEYNGHPQAVCMFGTCSSTPYL